MTINKYKVDDIVMLWEYDDMGHELGDGSIGCVIAVTDNEYTVLWNDEKETRHTLDCDIVVGKHPAMSKEQFYKELDDYLLSEIEYLQQRQAERKNSLRQIVAKHKVQHPLFWEKQNTETLIRCAKELGIQNAINILQKIKLSGAIDYDVSSDNYGKPHINKIKK